MTINVTKPFLPGFDTYTGYLEGIWGRNWLTNRGPLVTMLEEQLMQYLGLEHLLFVSNGTIAIQLAIKALNLTGEVITTPFSYVATTTTLLWENCTPVFADIEDKTFCLDAGKIESLITPATSAILATHVYGFPCDVEAIDCVAKKHNLKVIYDAAHAFGVKYKGRSLLTFGDISTCSFHATKVFHTGEGGAVVSNVPALNEQLFLYHTFGHLGDEYFTMGLNAKNSELHAAMGLSILPHMQQIIEGRKSVAHLYDTLLNWNQLTKPVVPAGVAYNYAYYPVVFNSEADLLRVKEKLAGNDINTRRYFYPSLNNLPYLAQTNACPVSEQIAPRVLCLPFYYGLEVHEIERITKLVNKSI